MFLHSLISLINLKALTGSKETPWRVILSCQVATTVVKTFVLSDVVMTTLLSVGGRHVAVAVVDMVELDGVRVEAVRRG